MKPNFIMRHHRSDTPAYIFWVRHQPFRKGKGRGAYRAEVRNSAEKAIEQPIFSNDIEVEIHYSTTLQEGIRSDVDNVVKPTLDALSGIAYRDDRQVRCVTASLFDLNRPQVVDGRVERMGRLFHSGDPNVLLIAIYSDTRLKELGGEEVINKKRQTEWEKDFSAKLGASSSTPDITPHNQSLKPTGPRRWIGRFRSLFTRGPTA